VELLIREARPDDAASIVAILNPIIEAGIYSVLDTPFTVEEEREFIASFSERGVFHLAEDRLEERAVGFQTVEPFATYTHAFDHVAIIATFVELSARRNGIGSQLAEATLEKAKRMGYEKLFTYVRADNETALEFYRKLGFRVVGTAEKQANCGGAYVDEIIIERFL
jgi:L-amino acid N-acyltransferase YncA